MGEAIITRRITVIDNALAVREIALAANNWVTEAEGQYSQKIECDLITENTIIDVFPDTDTLRQFMADGVTAIFTRNEEGNAEVVTLGASPTADIVLQMSFTETDMNENTSA